MSYADAKSTARSPGAMGATIAAHVALGWAILHLAGVTPDIVLTPEPLKLKPIEEPKPKIDPVEPPPQTPVDIKPYVPTPVIEIERPVAETPVKADPLPVETVPLPSGRVGSGDILVPPLPPAPKPQPVYTDSQLDRRHLAQFQPPYPSSAVRRGQSGIVAVAVKIGTDGRVTAASVATSSGHQILDEAAVKQALRRWRFKAATRDGVAIVSEQVIRVVFDLKDA
ncbi:MAG: energy transducer TonB [Pacificimonas sp.]